MDSLLACALDAGLRRRPSLRCPAPVARQAVVALAGGAIHRIGTCRLAQPQRLHSATTRTNHYAKTVRARNRSRDLADADRRMATAPAATASPAPLRRRAAAADHRTRADAPASPRSSAARADLRAAHAVLVQSRAALVRPP